MSFPMIVSFRMSMRIGIVTWYRTEKVSVFDTPPPIFAVYIE
jgi:hypothetical protein